MEKGRRMGIKRKKNSWKVRDKSMREYHNIFFSHNLDFLDGG